MKSTLLVAVSVLSLAVGSARAGEGNGEPFRLVGAGDTVVANPFAPDTGSETPLRFDVGPSVRVTAGDVLPTNGSEGVVQTANSLPRGFEAGTVAYAQAESVKRWMQARPAVTQPQTTAQVRGAQVGG